MNSKYLKYKWLYETYGEEMYSYGTAFGVKPELLEDAIHDVFLSLYEKDNKLWESDNIKYYLLTCLKNQIRTVKRREVNFETISNEDNYDFLLELSGLDIIEQKEERDAMTSTLQSMLNKLTKRQREAIYLRYVKESSFDEISQHFNIKTKAAQKLVYRAIDKMRLSYQTIPLHITILSFFKHIFWGI